jgi:hypothetical protein
LSRFTVHGSRLVTVHGFPQSLHVAGADNSDVSLVGLHAEGAVGREAACGSLEGLFGEPDAELLRCPETGDQYRRTGDTVVRLTPDAP